MSLEIGAVKEGKGGKRYAYVGGDEKSKDSWKEITAEPAKEGSDWMKNVETAAKFAEMGAFPLLPLLRKAGESVSPENADRGGGMVTDFAAKMGASPEVAAGAGYLTNVGIQSIPTILSGNWVKSGSESVLQPVGRRVMQSAVNPDKASRMSGDAAKAVETFLTKGQNPTTGGLNAFSKRVGSLANEVDDAINAADKAGATVSKVSMLKSVSEELKKISAPLDNADDVAQAKAVLQRILEDPRIKDLDEIPVRLAQDLKTATYKSLGEKAFNVADNMTTAKVSTLKSAIRGLKEGIERAVPKVVEPNKEMSSILNAIEVAEPGALAAGNKTLGGLSWMAENPMAAGGFMMDRSPLVRSILARFLYSGAPSILGNAARAGTAVGMNLAQDH